MIARTDGDIPHFIKLSNMPPVELYANAFRIKERKGAHVYNVYILKRIFSEDILQSIRYIISTYQSSLRLLRFNCSCTTPRQ